MVELEARERQSESACRRDKQEALRRQTHLLERDKDTEKERDELQKRVSVLEAREAELLRAAEAAMERERSMSQERSTALERLQVCCARPCAAHRQLLEMLLLPPRALLLLASAREAVWPACLLPRRLTFAGNVLLAGDGGSGGGGQGQREEG